jgi:ribosomal protein L32
MLNELQDISKTCNIIVECKTCGAGNAPNQQCKECNTLPSKD